MMLNSEKDVTIVLSGEDYDCLWAAIEDALRNLRRSLNEGLRTEYDEDAGIFRTTLPNAPAQTHLRILAIDALSGLYREMERRRQSPPSEPWLGLIVTRSAEADTEEGLKGGSITIAAPYRRIFQNLMGLVFQYSLVLSPPPEEGAKSQHAQAIAAGDSPLCYAEPDRQAEATAKALESWVHARTKAMNLRRKVLRRLTER